MVSDKMLAFTTRNKNLFIYQRNQHKINYLLDRVRIPEISRLLISQEVSYLYSFKLTHAQSISVSTPYLSLSNIAASKPLKISATSTLKNCITNFNIQFVEDANDIVVKESINDLTFKVDPTEGLSLNLKSYYGGINLKYNLPDKLNNNDFISTIKQVDTYDIKSTFTNPEKSTILAINSNSFYYIGVNSVKENMAYVDIC